MRNIRCSKQRYVLGFALLFGLSQILIAGLMGCDGGSSNITISLGPDVIVRGTKGAGLTDQPCRLGVSVGNAVRIDPRTRAEMPLYTHLVIYEEPKYFLGPVRSEATGLTDQRRGIIAEDITANGVKWSWRLEYPQHRLKFSNAQLDLNKGDVILATMESDGTVTIHGQFHNTVPYDPSILKTVNELSSRYPEIAQFIAEHRKGTTGVGYE